MKKYQRVLFFIIILFMCGCSHLHSFKFPSDQNSTTTPPVDLASFFQSNGFEKTSGASGVYVAIWRKFNKHGSFIEAVELWDDKTYVIEISSRSTAMQTETKSIADNLNQFLRDNPIKIKVIYKDVRYIDLS